MRQSVRMAFSFCLVLKNLKTLRFGDEQEIQSLAGKAREDVQNEKAQVQYRKGVKADDNDAYAQRERTLLAELEK